MKGVNGWGKMRQATARSTALPRLTTQLGSVEVQLCMLLEYHQIGAGDAGGYSRAATSQHAALAFGAWVSQDLVRKANRNSAPPHTMHGDSTEGYEEMPTTVADTAKNLKLTYDEWDYTSPTPQAPEYKRWLKRQLARGAPVAWFPLCKGDGHECYAGSCPNGGACDHVEPVFGLYSNRSLDELEA